MTPGAAREQGEVTPEASVVVATYARVDRLAACLRALRDQTRPPDEVIVVVHVSDEASARRVDDLAAGWPELRRVSVRPPGTVAAYNCALRQARGAIVAMIDDDAVASPDWLDRILTTFAADERIAAVGGRDVVIADGQVDNDPGSAILRRRRRCPEVGRIQWFGRMIANHHIGAGGARDVDLLKGVNMSFRRQAAVRHGFDERLRGEGAIVHAELSICLPLRREGLRLVYDPSIVVWHYPAPRRYGVQRRTADPAAAMAATHNETLAILDFLPPRQRLVFALWGVLIGSTGGSGVAILLRELLGRRSGAWFRFQAAQRGRAAAWRTRREPRTRPDVLSPGPPAAASRISVPSR